VICVGGGWLWVAYRRGVVFEISFGAVTYVESESFGDSESELLDGVDLGGG